ncbi:hypothetical protein QAD02_002866 [Eretmocerus hayati]|uniref:Uncharacterized protein n=1 Tax=Eretmocerus hayati TaxID=131215 RepID=A0ACC2NN04_9HYME|nr:hypothetical protein QAD02_002866 [Eretmocerus hayati]
MDPQVSEATALKLSEIHENAALAEAKIGEEIAGRSAPADRIHADVGQWSAQKCAEGPEVDATPRNFIEVVLEVDEDNLSPERPDFGTLYPHPVDALEQGTLWQQREDARLLERQRRTGEGSRALQAVDPVRGSSEDVGEGASGSLGLVEALLLAEGVDLASEGAFRTDEEMLAPPPEFADEATTSKPQPVEKE